MCSKIWTDRSTPGCSAQIDRLERALRCADAVVIGAGSGLSASAGFDYSGARFERYFSDFAREYGIRDMYSGGFYPFPTREEFWAYWSRYIFINRYQDPPKPVYDDLLSLVRDKDYFVITTNVDHCFQKAGFDKGRLFYTQGDYGLFQCSAPCRQETFDNEGTVRKMLAAQGFTVGPDAALRPPEGGAPKRTIPAALVPRCPHCGRAMVMNLRCDDAFAEDEGWHRAAARYSEFLRRHEGLNVLFLDLGTGNNTPGIIKYPFWRMTGTWENAVYACVNLGEAYAPRELAARAICIDGDIGAVLAALKERGAAG